MVGSFSSSSAALCALFLASCSAESRSVGADQPQTAPRGARDPRAAKYERNRYQVAQGGRYFTWYGCGACHGSGATGARDLNDKIWVHGGDLDQVYAFIARGHPGALAQYGDRVPVEQLWQITAYVRTLPQLKPEQRRRQDIDQVGEPQVATWAGPVR